MTERYKPSYYNLIVPDGDWTLLFNAMTSGLMRLPKGLADQLVPFLGPPRDRTAGCGLEKWHCNSFSFDEFPLAIQEIFQDLLRGHFFVSSEENETANLKERYEYYRRHDPFLVTITTTMDCNLGCYYCYEDKSKLYLNREGCDRILDWIKKQIKERGYKRLYTDWYGGEPMLNQDAIEYFSDRAIEYCDAENIGYSSSIISNGTQWPEDARGFIQRTRIRHLQFTFDGPRQHHDRRRRDISKTSGNVSSFDRIVQTIDKLIGFVRIYLRINVDPWMGRDVLSLVEFCKEKGWFRAGARFYPYLAMIGPMTDHCSFLGTSDQIRDFRKEFDALNHEFQHELAKHIDPRGIQHLQYYPMTKKINCAAVGHNSVVFGPDGLMYKCGLEVGDKSKAHGGLHDFSTASLATKKSRLVVLNQPNIAPPDRWEKYDPFSHPKCSQCQYLPVCMGGCPKTHFDQNDFYLGQQCRHWEENFDTIIRTYYHTAKGRPFAA
jgi:uncharacterized protein